MLFLIHTDRQVSIRRLLGFQGQVELPAPHESHGVLPQHHIDEGFPSAENCPVSMAAFLSGKGSRTGLYFITNRLTIQGKVFFILSPSMLFLFFPISENYA